MSPGSPAQEPVVITGGSGFLGQAISRLLAPRYDVVGIDVQPPPEDLEDVEWRQCDLTDDESVSTVLDDIVREKGKRLASVIHLAAYYDFSGEPSPLYEQLTVEGTRRLLRVLRGYQVQQFIFSSSILAMRPSDGEPLDESSPLEAAWDYPESKIRAEEVVRGEHDEIPGVILRLAGVYDEYCHSPPIGQQIARIHQKTLESFFFPGNAERGQSFVHLDDAADAFVKAVDRRAELDPLEVFVIGEPALMTYSELQETIGSLLHGKEWPALWVPKPLAKAGAWVKDRLSGEEDESFIKPWMIDLADAHYPLSIERAAERLGWVPSHRLRDTLPPMIERLQRDPRRWYEENSIEPPEEVTGTG